MSTPETSTECSSSPSPIHPPGRGRWVIWVIGFALLLMFGFMLLMMKLTGAGLGMGGALQMAAAQYTRKDVVGDLGGMPVTIPRHMAEFVEYEGDPGWGEKRHGPRPERTHASKLTSFGIQFRYPDMVTLSNAEMWQDKKSKSIFVTDWMDIGVTTGNRYAKDGFLDRLMQGTLKDGYGMDRFVRQNEEVHGLTFYILHEINQNTGQPVQEVIKELDAHWFFAKNKEGKVITDIRCSNVTHAAAPCQHIFSLESNSVHAEVRVHYRRGMLEHWKDIQEKVTLMILNFNAMSPEKPTPFRHL